MRVLLIAALCCAVAVWLIRRHRARAAAAALRQKEALWLRRMAARKRVRERMLAINCESVALLASMPECVRSAERHLDQAEADFAEGAFAPFWSSVERAAVSLGKFHECAATIETNSREYVDLLERAEGRVPVFAVSPASMKDLQVATATSARLHEIVRRAQRDFAFSVIYEHRRTNQVLVAGFRNLAEAVDEMASRITSSIETLTGTVNDIAFKRSGGLEGRPMVIR